MLEKFDTPGQRLFKAKSSPNVSKGQLSVTKKQMEGQSKGLASKPPRVSTPTTPTKPQRRNYASIAGPTNRGKKNPSPKSSCTILEDRALLKKSLANDKKTHKTDGEQCLDRSASLGNVTVDPAIVPRTTHLPKPMNRSTSLWNVQEKKYTAKKSTKPSKIPLLASPNRTNLGRSLADLSNVDRYFSVEIDDGVTENLQQRAARLMAKLTDDNETEVVPIEPVPPPRKTIVNANRATSIKELRKNWEEQNLQIDGQSSNSKIKPSTTGKRAKDIEHLVNFFNCKNHDNRQGDFQWMKKHPVPEPAIIRPRVDKTNSKDKEYGGYASDGNSSEDSGHISNENEVDWKEAVHDNRESRYFEDAAPLNNTVVVQAEIQILSKDLDPANQSQGKNEDGRYPWKPPARTNDEVRLST